MLLDMGGRAGTPAEQQSPAARWLPLDWVINCFSSPDVELGLTSWTGAHRSCLGFSGGTNPYWWDWEGVVTPPAPFPRGFFVVG